MRKPTTSAKAVADAIQEEIGTIARQGVPAADLARVKTKMRSDYYAGLSHTDVTDSSIPDGMAPDFGGNSRSAVTTITRRP